MNELAKRFGTAALKRALLLGVIGALVSGVMAAQAVTSTNLGSNSVKLAVETFTEDSSVTVEAVGILKNSANDSATGDSAPGLEATAGLPIVNNALTRGNYAYRVLVKEAAVDSWALNDAFKIEVYGDDGSTTTLLATLYTQQGVVDAVNVEGVTVTVDLGSSSVVHDSFDVVVTRQ